jgi:prophage regulatory protein
MLDDDLFPTAVYRLFNSTGDLLYVGMGDGRARIKSHLRQKPWRNEVDVSKTQLEWFDTRAEAASRETHVIKTEHPMHNIAGTSRANALGHAAHQRSRGPVRVERFTTRHYVGAGEIRLRLGVTSQRVQQLIGKPGFPAPYDELQMCKVWRIADIEKWIRDNRPDLAASEPGPTETPARKGPTRKPRADSNKLHDPASGT